MSKKVMDQERVQIERGREEFRQIMDTQSESGLYMYSSRVVYNEHETRHGTKHGTTRERIQSKQGTNYIGQSKRVQAIQKRVQIQCLILSNQVLVRG